jgi:hypothetical protein
MNGLNYNWLWWFEGYNHMDVAKNEVKFYATNKQCLLVKAI